MVWHRADCAPTDAWLSQELIDVDSAILMIKDAYRVNSSSELREPLHGWVGCQRPGALRILRTIEAYRQSLREVQAVAARGAGRGDSPPCKRGEGGL